MSTFKQKAERLLCEIEFDTFDRELNKKRIEEALKREFNSGYKRGSNEWQQDWDNYYCYSNLNTPECNSCHGTGYKDHLENCSDCDGMGLNKR